MRQLLGTLLVLILAAAVPAQQVGSTKPRVLTPEQKAARLGRQLELPDRCSFAWRGLLTIGAPAAGPLAQLTKDPRPEVAMRAFAVLGRLGADGAAALPILREHRTGTDAKLAAAADWALARIEFRGRLLTDYSAGKVEHLDGAGTVVRTIDGLRGPWHAEPVGRGCLLISEYGGGCVREIDADGKEVWRHGGLQNPYHTQRLPDGNTILCDAGNNQVLEVDRAGNTLWQKKDLKRPVAAVRTPDGHTLIVEQQGDVIEFDHTDQEVLRWPTDQRAMRAERLLNGNILVALHVGNQVVELGPDGRPAAKPFECKQAQNALRRRDGHTLVAATSGWFEYDAKGELVWQRDGRYAVGIYW